MHEIEIILGLFVLVAALSFVAARLSVPYPIILVLGGLGVSFIPGLPSLSLDPSYVFVLFLPPILFQAALQTSWRDFRANVRPIGLLAIGLVLFTTLLTAAIAHMFLGMSWSAGFVLGAIISPPDAVAATAIMQRLRIPKRIVTILEGESLVNDATALVAFSFATAAVVHGSTMLEFAAPKFIAVAAGGVAIGLLAGVVIAWVRPRLRDEGVESIVSLMTPYAAYLPAEWCHVSGVLAVVACGMFLSRKLPTIVDSRTRLRLYHVWDTIIFLLNALVFMLIGLQLPGIMKNIDVPMTRLIGYGVLVSVTAIAARMLWVFLATYLPRLIFPFIRRRDPVPVFGHVFLVAWTGMRGIVSLAAALSLPLTVASGSPFPHRDMIAFLAFSVILATLVVQGFTLGPLIRFLKLRVDHTEDREEALARYESAHAALARLEALVVIDDIDRSLVDHVRVPYDERIASLTRERGVVIRKDLPADARKIADLRREAMAAERRMLIKLRDDGAIADDVLRRVQEDLDLEESKWRD